MKNPKRTLAKNIIIFLLILTGLNTYAQQFGYAVRASLVKFDIDQFGSGAQLLPEDFYNGYEFGGQVSFKPSGTPFLFQSGLLFTHLDYEYFALYFGSVPLKLDVEIGKKAGVFLGPGFRFWYLLKVPENIYSYDYNRSLYSWNGRIGVFFTVKGIKFKLFPQIEFVKTPVYKAGYDYELMMTSYNLTIHL